MNKQALRRILASEGLLSKQSSSRGMHLQMDLPNYSRGDIDEFLVRPLKWLERDYKVYVLTGVGDVPYLALEPKSGTSDEDFVALIRRDFNKIVRFVADLYKKRGQSFSMRGLVKHINHAYGNQPLLKALRAQA